MRLPAAIILVGLLSAVSSFASDWPNAAFAEVRAYAYNKRGFPDRLIVEKGRLSSTVLNKRGVLLTPAQTTRLVAAVTGYRPRPESEIMCFDPRHAFVFYDSAKTPVAWVELCFDCSRALAQPYVDGQVYDVAALEQLAKELKLPLVPK
jgi:hypothetical protein